jgi:1,4-alpha-glucan branching enzyme
MRDRPAWSSEHQIYLLAPFASARLNGALHHRTQKGWLTMASATSATRQQGMGALPFEQGVAFRVWAPHAEAVFVIGDFNAWDEQRHPLVKEEHGVWYGEIAEAKVGDEYRYLIVNGEQRLSRIDPYAREVTNSVGNSIVHDPTFDWQGDAFKLPPWNELVIYEMHIGTFRDQEGGTPGTFAHAIEGLAHLKKLGVNVLEIMPAAEFAGDFSWGYNPAHIFAVEQAYGGPLAFKEFIREAHKQGFGVILDVVYNHFGPSDLDLWQFDGWSENDGGGIYFYNDWRSETPWGNTRPDYGRGEVRQFIRDNAMMWLEDYHLDGLRYDMTLYVRTVRGEGTELPEGWGLAQWINREISEKYPGKITIAEDLQNNAWLTKDVGSGGAGFGAQWCAEFVHPVREVVIQPSDEHRSLHDVYAALTFAYNGDPFERVIYSESHDEVANGKARVPSEIAPDDPTNFFAQKRSTLAAGLVFTCPGIPMLFQGQEFLQGGWFQDTVPLDWDLTDEYRGVVRLYRDLIRLRLNRAGLTRGLCGRNIQTFHLNEPDNMLAFHRWDEHGAGDDVVVVVNLSNTHHEGYKIGFPCAGDWKLRLNSDWHGYSNDFTNHASADVIAKEDDYDNLQASGEISIGPYTMLIYSQDVQP